MSAVRSRISSKPIKVQAAWDISIARTTVFMWPHQDVKSLLRGTKSDSCGTQWVYKYVAVDIYATLVTFVGRNLIDSSMRPFIMRSDSELLIFIARSWKKDGPAYADRFCKIRRDKIRFENPMAQVVRFWPKIRRLDPSDYQVEKRLRSCIK